MTKILTHNGYDYYEGYEMKDGKCIKYYCLVPSGEPAPSGGYYSSQYACYIKQMPNLFEPIKNPFS